jgi:hypothetical protein
MSSLGHLKNIRWIEKKILHKNDLKNLFKQKKILSWI